MTKNQKTLLIVAGLAIAAYLAYRWYRNRQAQQDNNSPTGSYGTNLNSVAPELVGGSSGPSVGPAVALPVHITLVEKGSSTLPTAGGEQMIGANTGTSANPIFRQTGASMAPANGGGAFPYQNSADEAANTSGNDTSGDDRTGPTADIPEQADMSGEDNGGP